MREIMTMRRSLWFLSLLFAPLLAPTLALGATASANLAITITASSAPAFYVATSGSDSNPGTLAAPFATLGKCQNAMQNSGTIKTCYIRAGTYHPTASGGGCVSHLGVGAVNLTPSDNGETWSYYPGDGYNTAIIDGGSSLGCAFYIGGASNITINGIQMQNFLENGVGAVDAGPGILITNNIIHDITEPSSGCNGCDTYLAAVQFECFGPSPHWGGYTISHNYIYNIGQMATRVDNGNGTAQQCVTQNNEQIIIANNYVRNVCATNGDCGAFYAESVQALSSWPTLVQYNYARDVDPNHVPDPVTGTAYGANMIYQDGYMNNQQIIGNVLVTPGSYSCWHADGSANTVAHGNICDENTGAGTYHSIVNYNLGTAPHITDNQTGNEFSHNLVIMNSNSSTGPGYNSDGPPLSPLTVTNNGYKNYGSAGALTHTCSGDCSPNANSDAVPTDVADPKITCWNVTIDPTSTIFNAPISFPALPTGWGTAGFWGPPGFTIPHTGTVPSWGGSC